MPADPNKILCEELGKLGGIGAKWIARIMPFNIGEAALNVRVDVPSALAISRQLLGEEGRLLPEEPGEQIVQAVIGAGRLDLNPVLITVMAERVSSAITRLAIHAIAKEGLFKQHSGEQAAQRILRRAQAVFPL